MKSKTTAYTSWQRQQARTAVANIPWLAEAQKTERERKTPAEALKTERERKTLAEAPTNERERKTLAEAPTT